MIALSLDGMKTKILRADETIASLEAASRAFLTEHYRIAGSVDADARAYVFSAFGETDLPPRFAVLAGEVIHHLRSCLDHVVTQLVSVEGGTPDHRTEFPICRTPETFEVAKRRGKVQGVSATALSKIEAAQPYHADPNLSNSTLLVLHELDIVDKHRLVLVVIATVLMASTLKIDAKRDVEVIGMSPPSENVRPTPDGTEVFRVEFGHKFDPEVTIDANFSLELRFQHFGAMPNVPVIKGLRHLRDATVGVIHGFFPNFVQKRPDGDETSPSV